MTFSSLNVVHDVFFSERSLIEGPRDQVGETIAALRRAGDVYEGRLPPPKGAPIEDWEDREQTLFRATAFGDDVDRPLMKSDGSYTYFASDIAYHKNKVDRGFASMIDVWGADHGGYIKTRAGGGQGGAGHNQRGDRRSRRQDRAIGEASARRRAGENVEAGRGVRDVA